MSFPSKMIVWLTIPMTLLILCGCGTDPRGYNDNEESSLFRVDSIEDNPGPFRLFEPIEDLGCDGVKADPKAVPPIEPDSDGSEGNCWPDGCSTSGEQIVFMHDQVTVVLSSNPMPGVEEAPALTVTDMVVEYRDRNGNLRPDIAPTWTNSLAATVPSGGTATMVVRVDDILFKHNVFLAVGMASLEEAYALRTWTLNFTFYAVEDLTGEVYVARASKTISLFKTCGGT